MDFLVDLTMSRGALAAYASPALPAADVFTASADTSAPAVPAGPVWVLDGLAVGWTMPEWPGQPDPTSCTFSLLCADPTAMPPLEVGVWVDVSMRGRTTKSGGVAGTYTTDLGRFLGQVTEATALPVMHNGQAMLAVTVTADDVLASWAELLIGDAPWPEEYAADRIARIMAAAGFTTDILVDGNRFKPVDVDHRGFVEVLDEHLRQLATNVSEAGDFLTTPEAGWRRPILQARVAAGAAVPTPFLATLKQRGPATPRPTGGPRAVTYVDGTLTHAAADTMAGGPVVGSATVTGAVAATEVEWKRSKLGLPNRVLVAGEFTTPEGAAVTAVTRDHPDLLDDQGTITRREDSGLYWSYDADEMAAMLLPDRSDYVGRWATERVTIMAGALDDDLAVRSLFNSPSLLPYHGRVTPGVDILPPFGETFHVHSLQEGHRLAGAYIAGQMMGARLVLQGAAGDAARVNVELTLARTIRRLWEYDGGNLEWQVAGYLDDPRRPFSPRTLDTHGLGAVPTNAVDFTPYDARLMRNEVI